MKVIHQVKAVLAGLVLSSAMVPVATAEDIEIYTSLGANGLSSNPNIMFMIDTSGSMSAKSWVKESYVDTKIYAGICAPNGIYFTGDGKIPNCGTSTDYFDRAALVCDHAVVGYTILGKPISPPQDGSLLLIGTYSDQLAQFDSVKNRWRGITIGTSAERKYLVECFSDSGIHGTGVSKDSFIADNSTGFTSTPPADPKVPHQVWSGGAGNLQLFDGNYINYLSDAAVPLVEKTYLEQVQAAVEIMVRGNTRVDIGLMRFDKNSEGGPVLYPIEDVGADRNDFFSRLKTLLPESYTPLSEVYYEALLYFGGKKTDYGQTSTPSNQTGSTYTSGGQKYYVSPISSECDKNYIVMLSDGQPTRDDVSAVRQGVLPGFTVGSCSTVYSSSPWDDNKNAFLSATAIDDNCMDEFSAWGFNQDILADDATKPETLGTQRVTTHTIGFQLGDPGGIQLMKDTATNGGGGFYEAKSEAELIKIFNLIIASALQVNSTFSSPAVSVNAFNRSTHLDDLYFTLFKPGDGNHWNGNLKKYKLEFEVDKNDRDGDGDITERLPFIADATSTAVLPVHAVDDKTGFFSDTSKSYWTSGAADGKEVSKGGAANVLTNTRNVYTTTGAYTATGGVNVPQTKALTSNVNEVDNANTNLSDALLGITGFPDIIAGTPYRETLLEWAAGRDALSQFGTANTYNDARVQMGDPLHAQPALVQYGGTATNPDLVAYVATNDGYLHAFDADDGKEIFSFIPQESLSKLSVAMEDLGGSKLYGLDGSVVAWINDINKDGIINGSDHVYLYVTQRRGGKNIYALDVTNRTSPELLWVIKGGTGEYTELGDTWSTVNVEKIKQGSIEKTVLMFGGGYDKAQDSATVRTTDSVGRSIYIADAVTGKRLWSGGKDGLSPTKEMEYSIPGRVKPLDISGDGFIDRIYAVDVGGQVFRFDIDNTNGALLGASITGGRVADLADAGVENARRFYYPPDVALIGAKDGKYHALVLSSGFRAHPLDIAVHDRIYMLKDRNTGLLTSNASYTTLIESDLHDATDNLAGGDGSNTAARDAELASIQSAEGWYIDLEDENNPGTWIGEKGLAEPLLIEGQVILTTYTPNVFVANNSCEPNIGLGKVFFLDIQDATPSFPKSIDKRAQRHISLARGGIPPSPNVIITKGGVPTLCIGTECGAADLGLGVRKTYWYEVEK